MQCKVDKGDLAAVLRHAVKVVPGKPAMDVLKCVRLTTADGSLTVEATDLDVTLRLPVAAAECVEGAACVDAKTIAAVVGKMPAGSLTLSMGSGEDARLAVEAENGSRVEVVTTPAEVFPELPAMPDGPGLEMDGGELARLFGTVKHAVSSDLSRPNLCGVYFVAPEGAGVLRAVATDGHRLAQAEVKAPDGCEPFDGHIVPSKGVDRLLEHTHGSLTLRWLDNALAASVPGGEVFVRLIEAAYPDYRQVIPKAGQAVVVDVAAMRAGVGVTATLASERTHGVRFDFGAGEQSVGLSSDNPERGRASAAVGFKGECPTADGKPVTIACNAAYFEQALAALDSTACEVQVNEGLAPLVVRPHRGEGDAGGVESLQVIMPMRL